MKKFLQSLNADEASQVLKALLDDDSDFVKKAYDIAMKVVGNANADEIMDEVYYGLDSLDVDDLYSRSGRTRHGYVDPNDEAWEMFEDALTPFIDEMKKNQQRALPAAAKNHCLGIIKGLRKYQEKSKSEFKDWVTDAPDDYIAIVMEEWKNGHPSNEDIAAIMDFMEGDPS
jgi:hypothetical protein